MPDLRRRRLLLGMGALNAAALTGTLWLPARQARAAAPTSVIEGRDRWLFAGWESVTQSAMPDCMRVLDLIQSTTAKLAARKIRTVMVIAPLKAAVCASELPDAMPLSTAVAARYAALCDAARQRKLTVVDSQAALEPLKTTNEAYIRSDYHWTGHAAEATAAETAKLILDGPQLAGTAGSGTKLGNWSEEFHYGDLAELLPPELKKQIGKDRFVIRSILTGSGLLDDTPPVVQIIGNSMSQPYLGFPQKLSNAIDRRVGLTWTFGDVGPWKTMLNYLESQAFTAHPPQTIVWQFNEGQMMYSPNSAIAYDPASLMPDPAWLARVGQALG